MQLRSLGLDVSVPQGWDGEIYKRGPEFGLQTVEGEVVTPIMHLANFPLPLERGDYGSGAVEIMNPANVLIVLFEHIPQSAGTVLFRRQGMPVVKPEDFAPHTMQRSLPGQSGAQYFFTVNGRPFCLYVVLGSHARRNELVPEVIQVLATVQID